MRPNALDLLDGVRDLLLHSVLPEIAAPHLRTQVGLAIQMLHAAGAELTDLPAAIPAERERLSALARAALPLVVRLAPGDALIEMLTEAVKTRPLATEQTVVSLLAEDARMLDLLDRLAALCEEHAAEPEAIALGRAVDQELRARVLRRLRWGEGVRLGRA
jgi:hypothetical protein